MRLPAPLVAEVEAALGTRLRGSAPIGGGCISFGARLDTERGERFFLKCNPTAPRGLFEAEADGLAALAAARSIRVPEVIAVGNGVGSSAWLLLEYVAPGRPRPDYDEALGEGLVALHRTAHGGCGWERDNFIGSLPQPNGVRPSWGEFWRDARLAPQLEIALERGHFSGGVAAQLERVVGRTPELLAAVDAEGPSLLHGDLWGGNVYADGEGRPVLIDPAVYRGHREVDLAMSELFGGFPAGWPAAYASAWPIDEGYHGFRRALYQLYYLLVHVNLFGASYEAACVEAARAAQR